MKKAITFKESETIELKKSLGQIDDALKTICGFLNHKGGKVYFGVSNSGAVTGLTVNEKTLRDISQQIAFKIKPDISPEIKTMEINGKSIIEIKVSEGANKPYFLNGVAYKKVGVEKRIMPPDELKTIFMEQRQNRWDSEICKGASIRDFDYEYIKGTFIPLYERILNKQIAGEVKDILSSIGCLINNKPTNAGILLFGKNPQKYFMNSYIALARYKEREVGPERLDYKEFKGNLFQQVDDTTQYIKDHTDMMSRLIPGRVQRMDIPEYGPFSIRELVTNAVVHRDYENQHTKIIIKMFTDRIEFYNPGGLIRGINPRNITAKQFSRNPTIANALAMVDYIEELGEGWDKIIKEHKEHPLKPKLPKIESDEYTFLVNIYSTKDKFLKTIDKDDLERAEFGENFSENFSVKFSVKGKQLHRLVSILALIFKNKPLDINEFVEKFRVSERTIYQDLRKLREWDIIIFEGAPKTGRYVLTETGKKLIQEIIG